MNIREVQARDIEQMVSVHLAAFPGFFLTMLGPAFLRLLYRGFINNQDGVCFIAENKGGIIGFVAGTINPEDFFANMLRRYWWAFTLASMPALLRSPIFFGKRLVRAVWYRGDMPKSSKRGALLSSIAVTPEASRSGVGKRLIEKFCQEIMNAGEDYVYLTTDQAENESVNTFYKKQGFYIESSFEKSPGRWMYRYIKSLEGQVTKVL